MSFENAKDHLKKYGFEDRVVKFSTSSATVELAAAAIGCNPENIAKSIALKVGDRAILILASGDARIDNCKYKSEFGVKAKMLSQTEVSELIGHDIGGVCPFGVNGGVSVYLDESLKGLNVVYAAAGSSDSVVRLTVAELEKASDYTKWVDVCSRPISKKTAVVFDLDGTLLNTLGDLTDSVNFALLQLGYSKRSIEEVRAFVGNGVGVLMELALPEGRNNSDFEKCLAIFKEHYAHNMENKTSPYDGITDMLKRLKAVGIKTAIVSNKFDLAVKGLSDRFFGKLIDCAIGETADINRKPAPDCIYKALDELGCSLRDALYVGDSEVDCATVKNAGIDFAAVSWGFRSADVLRKNGAVNIFDSPQGLTEYILALH